MNKLNEVIERLSLLSGNNGGAVSGASILDVLIATKLSQNTTDKSSFTAFKNLKKKFGSWDKVAAADLREITKCIKVCGLANTKSAEIKAMLRSMKKKYGTLNLDFLHELKDEEIYDILLEYKGIGRKTISCVLAFAMGRDAFPVDTHVHRILNRLGLAKTSSADATFELIRHKIPSGKKLQLHTSLIRYGRNVCRARNPLCGMCVLFDICEFTEKELSAQKTKSAAINRNEFIILENI